MTDSMLLFRAMAMEVSLKTYAAWLILILAMFDLTADLGVWGKSNCCEDEGIISSKILVTFQLSIKNPELADNTPMKDHACFTCCQHIIPELAFDSHPDWMYVTRTLSDRSQEKIFGSSPLLPPPQI